jgi:hypothetical protein
MGIRTRNASKRATADPRLRPAAIELGRYIVYSDEKSVERISHFFNDTIPLCIA